MKLTFDPAKSASNVKKHGVSLATAEQIEWDTLYAVCDCRHNYGEPRMIGYAYIDLRLYCVVFVDQDAVRRIISLRKANQREMKHYAKT